MFARVLCSRVLCLCASVPPLDFQRISPVALSGSVKMGTRFARSPSMPNANATKQRKSSQQRQQQQQQQPPMRQRVEATLKRLEKKDPGLRQFLKEAYGYAVFPSVGKASLVVGGAYGRGAVFERGKLIGYATISQMTLGVQIGGDTFT